jgi:hypothetical protein
MAMALGGSDKVNYCTIQNNKAQQTPQLLGFVFSLQKKQLNHN